MRQCGLGGFPHEQLPNPFAQRLPLGEGIELISKANKPILFIEE
ncbi:hypothetical protein GXM_07536 [Nostoc sphaeroides CCNUC1]|uniref:Uncharacterized protein n=1 Tax=Nostoc sphaeroides CCNUC1 TaxID=2653204 RepID=A0A5P8WBS4_9NOSO|nr:hypothetical protein GXM_07536 [Nostoc sphaeroides CCNUC1]